MVRKIKIIEKNGYHSVIAATKISKRENIIALKGTVQFFPTKYSIQVDENKHLIPFLNGPEDENSLWKFLNHSCAPNSYFDLSQMTLISLNEINTEEDISFNYCTTEYDMSSPFKCLCKTNSCYGEIKGFRHLPKERQKELFGTLASHLKKYTIGI